MRDHVVELAGDPGTLLDHRLPRGDVTLSLGDPCAALAVAENSPHEEHHDGRDERLSPAALQAWHIRGSAGIVDGGSVILLLAVATAGIAGRAFPRWLAWPALVLVLAILQLVPVSPYGFYASLLVLLWTAVAGVVMAIRPADGVPAAMERAAPAGRGGERLTARPQSGWLRPRRRARSGSPAAW